MLAGMVNISYHHNSLSCLVPPITTSFSGVISFSQFLLLSLTNENPPRVGSESRLPLIAATWTQSLSQFTSRRGLWLCRGACGSGGPLLHGHHVDDAFDLLDVLPFMASQPLRIEQHGP